MDVSLDDLIKKKSGDKQQSKGLDKPQQQAAGRSQRVPQQRRAVSTKPAQTKAQGLDVPLDSLIARKKTKPIYNTGRISDATRKRIVKSVEKEGKKGKVKGVAGKSSSKNVMAKGRSAGAKVEGSKRGKVARDVDGALIMAEKQYQRINQLPVGKPLKHIYNLSVNARKGKGKFAGLLTQAMLKKASGQRLRAATPLPARSSALLGDSGRGRRLISLPSYQPQTSASRKNLVLAELQRQRLQPYLNGDIEDVDAPSMGYSPRSGPSGGRMTTGNYHHNQRMVMGGPEDASHRSNLGLNDSERALASKIKVMAQLDKIPLPGNVQRRFMEGSFNHPDLASSRGLRGYESAGYDRSLH